MGGSLPKLAGGQEPPVRAAPAPGQCGGRGAAPSGAPGRRSEFQTQGAEDAFTGGDPKSLQGRGRGGACPAEPREGTWGRVKRVQPRLCD